MVCCVDFGTSGYEWDIIAAQQLKGIDLIVGGHSHTLLANKPYPVTIKNLRKKVPEKWKKFQGLQDKVEKFEDHVEEQLDHLEGSLEQAVADVSKHLPEDKRKDVEEGDHKLHLVSKSKTPCVRTALLTWATRILWPCALRVLIV